MTLCPIAIAVGCPKCPAFSVCPLKNRHRRPAVQGKKTAAKTAGKKAASGAKPRK